MFDTPPLQRPKRTLTDPVDPPMAATASGPVRRPVATAQPAIAPRPVPQVTRALPGAAAGSSAPQPAAATPTSWRPQRALGVGNAIFGGDPVTPQPQPQPATPVAARPTVRRTLDTFKPTLNSGTGTYGEPVYDNASVQRMAARPTVGRTLGAPVQPIAAEPIVDANGMRRADVGTRPPRTLSDTRPQVASTFGQPVTAMDDAPVTVRRPQASFRGADAMAEQYDASEDRDARQKQLSDLDSQRFRLEMIAGNPGRRGRAALEALGDNAQQQAALVSSGERNTSEAIQSRANRDNALANTRLVQDGEDRRTVFTVAGDAARGDADRSQARELAGMTDATRRAEIAAGQEPKSEYRQLADGSLVQVTGDRATQVKDGSDKPVRVPTQDPNTLTGNDVLKAYGDQRAEILKLAASIAPEDVEDQLAALDNSGLGQRYLQVLGMEAKPAKDKGGGGGGGAPRKVVRTGTYNGRRVVQYADGAMEYD